ncbi:L-serine ammonia-lyase [Marinoscillum sp. MHG1-6]|uniref:L-serine ammonia-lyase n=1 Tax=Marinoscillum sp. MHG1-6 TaxID=2959627 RepID=UPI0021576964|nr:L-serine ammonia-lyase [Marinoscillum sp. MHG1-6]
MEAISIFEILKIGIGPSSSHTLGPWKCSLRFLNELQEKGVIKNVSRVRVTLYGSLALTGKGHGTDVAVMMGLTGADPETVALNLVKETPKDARDHKGLQLNGNQKIIFDPEEDILFRKNERLEYHSNGMKFSAIDSAGGLICESVYYSVGGGFILHESETNAQNGEEEEDVPSVPYPCVNSGQLLGHCAGFDDISSMVFQNELIWRNRDQINKRLDRIWQVMKESIYQGCQTEGKLPGGLDVSRRSFALNKKLIRSEHYSDADTWVKLIKSQKYEFSDIIKWIGCFSMAVNEQNASFGRIVTAPTNGSAGVIPAVLLYLICFGKQDTSEHDIRRFLLTAGQIGILFKLGSTLSAAMGGCQAEIGVSSAMAAGALTECLGGTPQQAVMAAEMAMEHHLGLTCDPVGGLVQIPCIERNSMGAVKAVTAANIAMDSDPEDAKVSLDNVIKSMWETAKDMNSNYKETSLGGLAVNVSVQVSEC